MPRSVAGIAIRNGRVLVARRLADGDMGLRWEFPGGKVETGESDAAALVREFDEEFGIAIQVGETLGRSAFEHHCRRYVLSAVRVEVLADNLELREHGECRWVDGSELQDLDLVDSDRSLLAFVLPLLTST
jgi:8-oxo-dGTP diphosphatase